MTLILDFDRTIFDTEAFIESVERRDPTLGALSASSLPRNTKVSESVRRGDLSFKRGELTRFLYPGVIGFLKDHRSDGLILLTWGNTDLQKAKVESADIEAYFTKIMYTVEPKGVELKRSLPLPHPIIFVDDDGIQLDSVAAETPEVVRVWMRRVEMRAAPTALCMEVRSMEELDALLRNFAQS